MIHIISELNIKNGQIVTKEEIESSLRNKYKKIYEVIRVINKKPLFLREHLNRLFKSIELVGVKSEFSIDDIIQYINKLIEINHIENKNIRITYINNDEQQVILLYYIRSKYPEKRNYFEGVKTVTVNKIRKNPNIKINDEKVREDIDKIIKNTNSYEAIMVNNERVICEGSRSNIFFVKDNEVITTEDSKVLLGITRQKVIEVCKNNNIKLIKRKIYMNELENFQGSFITGTSINILPVSKINSFYYNSVGNSIIKKIGLLYMEEVYSSLNKKY